MAEFQIDTIKLRECGKDIITLTTELNELLNSLFLRISNVPVTSHEWTGNAANEFVRKLNIEKKYYVALKNNLNDYGKLLVNAADKLELRAKNESRL